MSLVLEAQVEALHNRAITQLMVVAAGFRELGELRMSDLYEARARDLEVQRERHVEAIRRRGGP